MVMRHPDRPSGKDLIYTATQDRCPDCGRVLGVYQVDGRRVQGLDFWFWMKRRDKRCHPDCPGLRPIHYATRDLRVVLPKRIYGLDVTLHVGERHLLDGVALARITRDLNQRGLPIDQRHTGRVFRDFVALTMLSRGDDAALQNRLRDRGGIVLMCDGVQFEDRSPVLYLVWDALSGEALFGERKPYKGADDLVPLLERVRAMNVPVIGIATDKEKGLVPAVERVFPDVPYQFCQTHFLRNCAKPMQPDLTTLQVGVRRRADAVRKIGKRLSSTASASSTGATVPTQGGPRDPPAIAAGITVAGRASPSQSQQPGTKSEKANPPRSGESLSEEALALEVCELARVNSRISGRAPFDPPELKRHDRLEDLRTLVNDARKKTPRTPTGRMAPA